MSEPVSTFQADLEAGKFVITAEIGPPKGINMGPVMEEAEKCLKSDRISAGQYLSLPEGRPES